MSKRGKGRGRGKGRTLNLAEFQESNLKIEPTIGRDSSSTSAEPSKVTSSDLFPSLPSSAGRGRGKKQQRNVTGECSGIPKKQFENLSLQEQTTPKPVENVSIPTAVSVKEQVTPATTEIKPISTVTKFAARPNYGKEGRKIQLVCNYYELRCNAGTIFHYDVEVTSLDQVKKYGKPVRKKTAAEAAEANITRIEHQLDKNIGKLKCRQIFESLVKSEAYESYNPVYDGAKNIFTSKPLPFESKVTFVIELEFAGKTRKYQVAIQPVKKEYGTNAIDLASLLRTYEGQNELIMALNSIMNHRDPSSTQVQIGRSFFYLNQPKKSSLGEGLEIWYGYNQSIHLTHKGPVVVINISSKAFHKSGPVLDYIHDVLRRDITVGQPMKYHEIKKVEDALRGLKVHTIHLSYKRKYVIQGLTKTSANNLKIPIDNKEISIAEYFQMKYKQLQYPDLPCLFMRSSNNHTYIPIENCEVVEGQPKLGKLNGVMTSKMIRETAIEPIKRFENIEQCCKDVRRESGKKMTNYRLFMDLVPKNVEGRVIKSPSLYYRNNVISDPDERGVWRIDGKNFYKTRFDIQSWVLLSFAMNVNQGSLEHFVDVFTRTGRKVGLNFGEFLGIRKFGMRDTSENALFEAKRTNASFAVIVLSRKDTNHNYDEIKFIADYRLGFITQCIEDCVLLKISDQIATNICLKVNTKLGGVNHILKDRPKVFAKPVMILGADAVHSPRGSGCPSIAAVVGSMDALPSKYKVECRVQHNPDGNKVSQEIILDIKAMVISLLDAFKENTRGKYPEKIVFFRDGVSEGQFQKVRDEEVGAVQAASLETIGIIVPITYIIVQKRHQTRFRPVTREDGVGRHKNIPPGTTVDNDITHPDLFDYFLNSHEGLQGTSKPAHYTVLHDDNDFDADELQMLSYHLCYMYGKCNRSISIPAPVMYADLACYRAKKYADFHIMRGGVSSSSSNSGSRLPEHVREAIDNMGQFKTSMFFV